MMQCDHLLTVNELAGLLSVPKSWIYDRTRAGGPEFIPHIKVGKYVRFDPIVVARHFGYSPELAAAFQFIPLLPETTPKNSTILPESYWPRVYINACSKRNN